MEIVYQVTFFVGLTLLAIVVTVFVFAVSLLGRAAEVAAKEQEKTTKEQKDSTEQRIAEIKSQMDELTKKKRLGEELEALDRTLKELIKEDKRYKKKLKRIEETPQLLSVKGGVIYAAIPLGISLVFSGVGWYYPSSATVLSVPISPTVWILSLSAIGYGIYRILKSLRAVESVAVTSTEVAEGRLAQAVKRSLTEMEESRKPLIRATFSEVQPPFHVKADAEVTIELKLEFVRGDVARGVMVYVVAPPEFKFLVGEEWRPPDDEIFTDFKATCISSVDIISGTFRIVFIKFKVPAEARRYPLIYRVFCEGYSSDYTDFEVIVERAS